MKGRYVWYALIGGAYLLGKISGTVAFLILVGLAVAEHFESQEKKLEELSEKIDEMTGQNED